MKRDDNAVMWRRNKVLELLSKGYSQAEIARSLKVSKATISRDVVYITDFVYSKREEWPTKTFEHNEATLHGYNEIIKALWGIADNAKNVRERLQALSLLTPAYEKRLECYANRPMIARLKEQFEQFLEKESWIEGQQWKISKYDEEHGAQ